MVTYGYPNEHLAQDLAIARWLTATVVEVLPLWRALPDPAPLRRACAEAGVAVHSVHGSWGGQSITTARVDLANPDWTGREASVDDLRRCLDWLAAVEGRFLVVHPGGLSLPSEEPARRAALMQSLDELADHIGSANLRICVENMPPGVHPGQSMADLHDLVEVLDRPEVGLALDTGHAHLSTALASETRSAGHHLWTTHVHDNDGHSDTHLPPGSGGIAWSDWPAALDAIGYRGPILLECIRHLRENPESRSGQLRALLRSLTDPEGESPPPN
jgi:sugar phosphate isomerase/epimerase